MAGIHEVLVNVEGGELRVSFHYDPERRSFHDIYLIGKVREVFTGYINLNLFL